MTETTLISANQGFHTTLGRKQYTFKSRSVTGRIGIPKQYTRVSYPDGRVTLVEYSSPEEYEKHKQSVAARIAARHKRTGLVPGCNCKTCSL